MTRRKLLIGNWKMFKTATEARAFAADLNTESGAAQASVDLAVCPPFTAISALVEALPESVKVGAQNVYFEEQGAFTGEISPAMLVDAGVTLAIVGHSERRTLFGETDAAVGQKAVAAVKHGLTPVICVGENLAERDANQTAEVVARQTRAAIAGLSAEQVAASVVAYEPVWAIGSGRTPEPGDAEAVIDGIRKVISEDKGSTAADAVRILYGGSVKPENIAAFGAQPNIDGALVGGASLDASSFARMATALAGGN
ncbi:triose-phosphate isomerase [Alicyclobacillus sp. ALC3]|uniref:triose-phosphate isomerase n=1 Tax=Alicyclobacillus sp. ALC3 TaxID=2796143 RepID=UPI00237895AE|nr:triose-phosphate isomerase [Alicyclobacillus sp. ALC3]WDL98515.1 triose-phosphate isomerase [Alicyclobacillus sp. ALC3]